MRQLKSNNAGFCSEIELVKAITGNADVKIIKSYTESVGAKA